jgi:hypothetical protein
MKALEDLIIEGTKSSPAAWFYTNGKLKMEGRSMPDNPAQTFSPMINWVEHLKADEVVFDIHLDYLNTSSSMQLFTILRILDENCEIHDLVVNWHYEEDDEDHFETGVIFQEKLRRTKFNYLNTAEV